MLPHVPPHEFGSPDEVGVAVAVAVGVAEAVAVAVAVPVGVAVVKVNAREQLLVGEVSSAFGLLLGTFGATDVCLSW